MGDYGARGGKAELQDRLRPVLGPELPEPEQGLLPEYSEARSRLHDLHALTGHLRKLLDRLEV